jgi:hypothetical protein
MYHVGVLSDWQMEKSVQWAVGNLADFVCVCVCVCVCSMTKPMEGDWQYLLDKIMSLIIVLTPENCYIHGECFGHWTYVWTMLWFIGCISLQKCKDERKSNMQGRTENSY